MFFESRKGSSEMLVVAASVMIEKALKSRGEGGEGANIQRSDVELVDVAALKDGAKREIELGWYWRFDCHCQVGFKGAA